MERGKDNEPKIPEQLAEVAEIGAPRARNLNVRTSETALEASRNIPQLPVSPNGIFKHPSTWTAEEDEIIARGIKAHLPLQVIGTKVNCERGTLSRHIKNTPDLLALFEDAKEDLVDRGEFEADRLMRAGNPSMVMFVLERMGRKRGWGQQEYVEPKGEDDIIQFTPIPESEIERADNIRKEMGAVEDDQIAVGEIPKSEVFSADLLKNEIEMEEAAKEVAAEKKEPSPVKTEQVSVSPPPYDNDNGGSFEEDGFADDMPRAIPMNQQDGDDAFAGGEFSPFGGF